MNHPNMKVSIILLCHNAREYVLRCLDSIERQVNVNYELIIVDNDSAPSESAEFFRRSFGKKPFKFLRSPQNLFFSGGMNLGARCANRDSTHLLLLNSDVEFLSEDAIQKLLRAHRRGATGFEFLTNPDRSDGFCLLVDRDIYDRLGGLDEHYKWWWSITKLQGQILSLGFLIQAIENYQDTLVHYGGKSGDAWRSVNISECPPEAEFWFPRNYQVSCIRL